MPWRKGLRQIGVEYPTDPGSSLLWLSHNALIYNGFFIHWWPLTSDRLGCRPQATNRARARSFVAEFSTLISARSSFFTTESTENTEKGRSLKAPSQWSHFLRFTLLPLCSQCSLWLDSLPASCFPPLFVCSVCSVVNPLTACRLGCGQNPRQALGGRNRPRIEDGKTSPRRTPRPQRKQWRRTF